MKKEKGNLQTTIRVIGGVKGQPSQPQHTDGNYCVVGPNTSTPIIAVPDRKGKYWYIAKIYCEPSLSDVERQANAQRIVKAVNMHDELMEFVKGVRKMAIHKPIPIELFNKMESLLKQAE